jgi:hypothetical protein
MVTEVGDVGTSGFGMKRMHRTVSRIIQAAFMVAAIAALSGCMFGDEPKQAPPSSGPWFDPNCVPVECLYECCQGWNYNPEPGISSGYVPGSVCEEVRTRTPAYSDYIVLMTEETSNWCPEDFKYFESGYCEVVKPPDVIKKFGPDGKPVYAGLDFPVCPPRGQISGHHVEGVELTPKD